VLLFSHLFDPPPVLPEIQVGLMTLGSEPRFLLEVFIRLIQNLSLQKGGHVRNDYATQLIDA
jgi:hypothetical protein